MFILYLINLDTVYKKADVEHIFYCTVYAFYLVFELCQIKGKHQNGNWSLVRLAPC